ncbi:MAG: hypothetical protein ACM35H_03580 [Bacteroidota bacterium]|nr:hypothetical protein [Kiloniellaceae bacterium]
MLDRFIGIAAFVVLVAFMLVLFYFIPDFDLGLLIVVVSVLAGYDFYIMLFKRRQNGR